MNEDTSWEANHRFIRLFVSKVLKRAIAAGVRGLEFEDLLQEASIAWMAAKTRYNPNLGVPFLPYLRRGMQFHLNRFLKYEIDECQPTSKSLDYQQDFGNGEGASFSEIVADERIMPQDEFVMRNQHRDRVHSRLSPVAKRYLELLEEPPPELFQEFRAIMAKAELGRSLGHARFAPVRITSDLIFKLMGLSHYERANVNREITEALRRVERR